MRLHHVSAIACLVLALTPPVTKAAITVTIEEVGGDVVASASGTINTTGLSPYAVLSGANRMRPLFGDLSMGTSTSPFWDAYSFISGPATFGTGGLAFASSTAGDSLLLDSTSGLIAVPVGYVSGTTLAATATWSGESFLTLGINPGTYVWTWGSGGTADLLTMQIGNAVPEPSSAILLALAGIASRIRLKRKALQRSLRTLGSV